MFDADIFGKEEPIKLACQKRCVEEAVLRYVRALEGLHEVTLDIGSQLELSVLLGRIVERAIDLIHPACGGALYLYQPSEDMLQCMAAQGKRHEHEIGRQLHVDQGCIGQVFQTGTLCCREDDTHLIVPMCWHNQVIGVLLLDDGDYQIPFSGEDLRLAEMFAAQAAVAVNNADVHRALRCRAEKLNEDVRLKREQIQAILENTHSALVLTDAQGIIEYVNPAFTRLLGYELGSVAGTSISEYGETSPHAHANREHQALPADQKQQGEAVMLHKDGSLREMDMVIVPLFDAGGEVKNFVGSLYDIGHFKALDRMKDQFMQNVSQELRTPLSNLRLYIQLLQSGRKPEKYAEYLRILEAQTQRLIRVTEKIIDATRFSDSDAIGSWHRISAASLLADTVTRFQGRADDSNVNLITSAPQDVSSLYIHGDPIWLARALEELLENAIIFSPDGSIVQIVAQHLDHAEPARLAIHVQDNGPGIQRKELTQILQHNFVRGQIGEEGNVPGIGLGLTIVRMVLARHGGDLAVQTSEKGSTFTLILPLAE